MKQPAHVIWRLCQNGFTLLETYGVIVIVVLIVAVGWLVDRHSRPSTKDLHSTHPPITSTKTVQSPNPAQYAGWLSFCSSYGGLCLMYPPTWKLTQSTNAPGSSSEGQEVDVITSPSGSVKVLYLPSASVTGIRRSEDITVAGVSTTAIPAMEVVRLIDNLGGSPPEYTVEDFVTLTSAAHSLDGSNTAFTAGTTIASSSEPPYHQFTNPERPSNIGQQLLAVTEANGAPDGNIFTSSAAAEAWLNSSEVQTATQILDSVTYSP